MNQSIDEIPQKIIDAVSTHGYTNPNEAERELGPLAWQVVRVHGGWDQICKSLGITSDVETEKQRWKEWLGNKLPA